MLRETPDSSASRRVEGTEHSGGACRVVVLQGHVVVLVDVARLVLSLEVLERPEEELALLLEGGPPVGVHHAHRSARDRSTRARSSSEAEVVGARRHRAKAAVTPASPSTRASTGRIQTTPSTPELRA